MITRESFSPENIHEFIPEDEYTKVICGGSYYWFNGIEGFQPHDYDYMVFSQSDQYAVSKLHYMFIDAWMIAYNANGTKQDFIDFVMDEAINKKHSSAGLRVLIKPACDIFGITYEDIEPYMEALEQQIIENTNIHTKYKWYQKIIRFIRENRSLELTPEQRQAAFEDYVACKRNFIREKMEKCKYITLGKDNE